MIVQAVKVVLEESELAAQVRAALGAVSQLKEVTFGLVPGAVIVGGKFQLGFAIPFETQWTVEVLEQGLRLGVRLAHVSVGLIGMSASMVSSQVMAALAQKLQGVPGMAVENDAIMLDPAVVLASKGVRLEAQVKRISVLQGCVEVEAG
jgi:hypothetical protein